MEHKIAAYADDLLFFLTNPEVSIPRLLQCIAQYEGLSNFSINDTKCEAMSILLSKECIANLQGVYRFKWVQSFLKYLGVKLTPDKALLYGTNFCPLLLKMRSHFQLWQTLALTWFGRCNAFKMTLLPQIL